MIGFQPEVNERLVINGHTYTVGEHPHAPDVPYGQEGRQGTVYLLHTEDGKAKKAMKVFRSKFVNPSMAFQTQQIAKYKGMSGLSACDRFMITPQNNTQLLSMQADLLYAVVMNWVEGPTWMDLLLNKQHLTKKQSYSAAYALAHTLAAMEQRGLAHCDLSAPNLILPMFDKSKSEIKPIDYVQLIDLEQMYASHLVRPEYIPTGSPGYAPQYITSKMQAALWNANSDRFAGAVLLMEMLGACTETFFDNIWGESYFDPAELQVDCSRYYKLIQAVRATWGEALVSLFTRAWESEDFSQCPTFGEWLLGISKVEYAIYESSVAPAVIEQAGTKKDKRPDQNKHEALLARAKQLESRGKFKAAIEVYRSMQSQNLHASLAKEIEIAIAALEKQARDRKNKRSTTGGVWISLRSVFSKVSRKAVWSVLFITILVLGAYSAFAYFQHPANRAQVLAVFTSTSGTTMSSDEARAQIESLSSELKEKDKVIAELNAQVKELSKPMAKRREEFIDQLNHDFSEIKKVATSDAGPAAELDKKTFAASTVYMNHLLDFVKVSFQLNHQFVDQANVVQGYHYPYMYNEKRNAQLNIQFFKDYKEKF